MARSGFGIEHGSGLSKAMPNPLRMLRRAKKAESAAAEPIKLAFKPVQPRTTPLTGPGSQRGTMDPTAWASRTAASRRAQP